MCLNEEGQGRDLAGRLDPFHARNDDDDPGCSERDDQTRA